MVESITNRQNPDSVYNPLRNIVPDFFVRWHQSIKPASITLKENTPPELIPYYRPDPEMKSNQLKLLSALCSRLPKDYRLIIEIGSYESIAPFATAVASPDIPTVVLAFDPMGNSSTFDYSEPHECNINTRQALEKRHQATSSFAIFFKLPVDNENIALLTNRAERIHLIAPDPQLQKGWHLARLLRTALTLLKSNGEIWMTGDCGSIKGNNCFGWFGSFSDQPFLEDSMSQIFQSFDSIQILDDITYKELAQLGICDSRRFIPTVLPGLIKFIGKK